MKRIQSKKHILDTYDICKVSFSCFGDKRYWHIVIKILDDYLRD